MTAGDGTVIVYLVVLCIICALIYLCRYVLLSMFSLCSQFAIAKSCHYTDLTQILVSDMYRLYSDLCFYFSSAAHSMRRNHHHRQECVHYQYTLDFRLRFNQLSKSFAATNGQTESYQNHALLNKHQLPVDNSD